MKRLIPVRWSHLLSYSGVGALECADNDLFVVMDIGRWTDREGEPAGELLHYVDLLLATLEIDRGWPLYGRSVTPGELLAKEFRALSQPIPDLADGEDFVPRHQTDAWRALPPPSDCSSTEAHVLTAVDRLVAVTRLREIRIFTGFTRVTQNFDDGLHPTSAKDGARDEPIARLVPPDLDGSQDWLPAIELYGEGIFFTLDEDMLARWAQQPGLRRRTEQLQQRFERAGIRFPDDPPLPLSLRFILLHTLAHLLIHQLEMQAGYPAASIRERIYCTTGKRSMAGILVYVAVPDVVGSLGGLAELAQPERFLRLLTSVFDHADWCSLDPVCAEHQGQGPGQLNLAACHACALVPEPSCTFTQWLSSDRRRSRHRHRHRQVYHRAAACAPPPSRRRLPGLCISGLQQIAVGGEPGAGARCGQCPTLDQLVQVRIPPGA